MFAATIKWNCGKLLIRIYWQKTLPNIYRLCDIYPFGSCSKESAASVFMSPSGCSHLWARGSMNDVTGAGWIHTNYLCLAKFLGVKFSRMWKKVVIQLCSAKLVKKKCKENSFQKRDFCVPEAISGKKLHCYVGKMGTKEHLLFTSLKVFWSDLMWWWHWTVSEESERLLLQTLPFWNSDYGLSTVQYCTNTCSKITLVKLCYGQSQQALKTKRIHLLTRQIFPITQIANSICC